MPDSPNDDTPATAAPVDVALRRTSADIESEFREREVAVKEGELELQRQEQSRAGWSNPLVVALFAAAIGAIGNALITYAGGVQQRQLEAQRAEQARLLEMIRTGNAETAAGNLQFLVDTGLLTEPAVLASVRKYLATRKPGTGPVLPSPGVGTATSTVTSTAATRAAVTGAASRLLQCLAATRARLAIPAEDSHNDAATVQMFLATSAAVSQDMALLQAQLTQWEVSSPAVTAVVPSEATLQGVEALTARLNKMPNADVVAVLKLAAEVEHEVALVHLFVSTASSP